MATLRTARPTRLHLAAGTGDRGDPRPHDTAAPRPESKGSPVAASPRKLAVARLPAGERRDLADCGWDA